MPPTSYTAGVPPTPTPPRPIVVLGPTAGGKSDLAAALAEHLGSVPGGGEVIGADSMQVYRHLDAGTAKPPHALRNRVPHRLIDIVEPTERFTVHDWLMRATAEITRVQTSGTGGGGDSGGDSGGGGVPIVVGGTNLYLKALLDGMFDGPGQDASFRASLDAVETVVLHERLKQFDPPTADRVKPADRQRIVRALEVYELTGQPISALQTQWEEAGTGSRVSGLGQDPRPETRNPRFRLLGLRWSAEHINPRINLRVKAMFYPDKVDPELAEAVCINGESLVDETQRLKDEGKFDPIPSHQAVPEQREGADHPTTPNQAREALGYKQLLAVFEGTDPKLKTIHDAYERTKVLTRRFAKQQRTWLKRFTDTHWIDCGGDEEPGRITEQALSWATQPHAEG